MPSRKQSERQQQEKIKLGVGKFIEKQSESSVVVKSSVVVSRQIVTNTFESVSSGLCFRAIAIYNNDESKYDLYYYTHEKGQSQPRGNKENQTCYDKCILGLSFNKAVAQLETYETLLKKDPDLVASEHQPRVSNHYSVKKEPNALD